MKNSSLLLIVILVFVGEPLRASKNETQSYIANFRTLLTKYVQESDKEGIKTVLVDYVRWGQDPLHQTTIASLQQVDPKLLFKNQRMAFWINAYNLLTIDLIIKTKESKSIRNQGNLFKNVWKRYDWNIHDKQYTLHAIEHHILRPMGDPRIHFAINCASLSCPDLRKEPYLAETLETVLHEQTLAFLSNNTKGVSVNDTGLKISKIFKWFEEDFDGKQGVEQFIHRHLPKSGNMAIDNYFNYNWSLNSQ